MSIYFTSDTHFNHGLKSGGFDPEKNILKFCPDRGFPNTAQGLQWMNETIISNWNSVVRPTDTVYFLGDFALGIKEKHQGFMDRLNGDKRCTPGNHDKPKRPAGEASFGWSEIADQMFVEHDGYTLWLSHVPSHNGKDHVPGRDLKRPEPTQPYDIELCGHVHDEWLVDEWGTINVGVDQWSLMPVHVDAVINLFENWRARTYR